MWLRSREPKNLSLLDSEDWLLLPWSAELKLPFGLLAAVLSLPMQRSPKNTPKLDKEPAIRLPNSASFTAEQFYCATRAFCSEADTAGRNPQPHLPHLGGEGCGQEPATRLPRHRVRAVQCSVVYISV